jgi:tRNA (mo5U34)-methyltransferase
MRQDTEELLRKVNAIPWFHQIDLGNGLITPGPDQSEVKLGALKLPSDLTGVSVLDIGAWNGYFSFACERRGATVTASDHFCWGASIDGKAGFDLAKKVLGSRVAERRIPVEEIRAEIIGTFDVVLFLGVLYHAPDPLGYLRNVRSVTRKFAVIETYVDLLEVDRPALAYYPADSLNKDPTNFFGPNEHAVRGMCQDAGFSRVEVVDRFYQPSRMVFHAFA